MTLHDSIYCSGFSFTVHEVRGGPGDSETSAVRHICIDAPSLQVVGAQTLGESPNLPKSQDICP